MIKLSPLERRLIQYFDLSADAERSAAARALGTPLHKVHYALNRLAELGVLRGRVALVDYGRLGRTPYSVLLGLAPFTETERRKLARLLEESREIAWASEVLGSQQLSFQIIARSPSSVREAIRTIQTKLGSRVSFKAITVRHSLSVYQRRYLTTSDNDPPRDSVILSDSAGVPPLPSDELDDLDWKCLRELAVPHNESLAALARKLGIPAQTFHRRVMRLRELGVVKGFMGSINFEALGIRRYKLLIETTGFDLTIERRLAQLAHRNPHVTNFAVCLGQWDYELSLETWNDNVVSQLLADLGTALGTAARDVRVLPIMRYYKFSFQFNRDG